MLETMGEDALMTMLAEFLSTTDASEPGLAAGVVGMIKVIEAMRHGVIPPSINFSAPNRYIDFDNEHMR